MYSRLTNHWIYQVTCLKGDMGAGEILALAGLATGVTGTGLSLEAGAEEQNKMNKTLSQELSDQTGYQKKGQSILNQNIQQSTPQEAQKEMGQGAQQALQQYSDLEKVPAMASSPTSTGGSASQAVVSDDANARANILNLAQAPIQGLNDWQTQQWINNLKAKTALQQNNMFSQMRAGLLPAQLQSAQQSSQGMSSIGSLLNTAGGLMASLGATMPQQQQDDGGGSGPGNTQFGSGGWDTGNTGGSTGGSWDVGGTGGAGGISIGGGSN